MLSVFVLGPLLPPSSFLFCLVMVIKTLKTSKVVFIQKQAVSSILDFHLQLGGVSCSPSLQQISEREPREMSSAS